VLKGFAVANPKLGNIGITVKIMLKRTELSMNIKKPEAPKEEPKAEKEAPPKEPSKEEPATEQTEQIVNEEGTEE